MTDRPARVALLGNVANCLLPVALALREAGIDADLFVDDEAPATYRPETARPDLAEAPWVRRGPWQRPLTALAPWRSPVVAALRDYDLLIVSGPGPLYAQWAGRPWAWWVSGGDLTVTPFPWAFRTVYGSTRRRLGAVPLALWQRRAARRATELWVQPFTPFVDALRRLRIGSPPVSPRYLPLIVDDDDLRPDAALGPQPALAALEERLVGADPVVFHPSRILIDPSPANRRAGQWKGNDRLLRGVAELVARGEGDGVLLVIPDLETSRDAQAAKELVASLGIGDHVLWARPPRAGGFDRREMRHLYARSHVVADEFGAGWFGFVTLEGLAMGRPVLSHVDEAAMHQLYPGGHPICSALTPEEIADRLAALRDPAVRAAVGEAGRAWVVEHHSPAAASRAYVAAASALLGAAGEHRQP